MSFHIEDPVPEAPLQDDRDPNPRPNPHPQSTLQHLTASWVLLVFRIYHGWLFLLSLVVIAGYSCNDLLNLFLRLTQQDVEIATFSTNLTTLYTKSLLIAFLATGLLQHGFWLLQDSVQLDMFRSYRRTLCWEGPGRDFAIGTRIITLEEDSHKVKLLSMLTENLQLRQDLPLLLLNGHGYPCNNLEAGIQGAKVPARSQLVDVRIRSTMDIDSLSLDGRVQLRFRLPQHHRLADFNAPRRNDRIRAWVDVISQFIILGSIDIWPLVSAAKELSVMRVVSLEWVNTVVTRAITVCVFHMAVYYLWSTILDYYWKIVTFRKLAQGQMQQEPDQQASQANVNVALLQDHAQEHFAYVETNGHFGSSADNDDSLNLFVRMRELLMRKEVQWMIMGLGITLFVLCGLLWVFHKPSILLGAIGLALIVIFTRFFWCTDGQTARQLAEARIGRYSTAEPPVDAASRQKIFWFGVNCSLEQKDIILRYGVVLLAAALLVAVGVYTLISSAVSSTATKDKVLATVVFLLSTFLAAFWCLVVIAVCLCYSEFWKFMLVQKFCFALLAMLSSPESFGMTVLLLLITQVGMSRHGRSRSHGIFLTFFTIYITIIAAIAFTTAADDLGHDFHPAEPEWCRTENCTDYTFPLHGFPENKDSSLCGLSWPVGVHGTESGNVSRICPDTRLTLADFGHFARVPYFLEGTDTKRVEEFLSVYLPGWEVKSHDHFSITGDNKATYVHIRWLNTSVVAIRGTSSAAEVFQDVNFWMPSAFLQTAQILGPSLFSIRGILPLMTSNFSAYRNDQIRKLLEAVTNIMEKHEDAVYVTGHSLGGGLASMIGGMLQIPAVTFSAPGIGDTSKILDPPEHVTDAQFVKGIRHMDVNVIPEGDVVPKVDRQAGMIVPLDCDASTAQCHWLNRTMCTILEVCGDGGGREHPRHYRRSRQACDVDWGKHLSRPDE